MKVTILGAGAWGSSLAKLLHESGNEVTLWAHNAERLARLAQTGRNEPYLPDVQLPTDFAGAIKHSYLVTTLGYRNRGRKPRRSCANNGD